MNGGGESHPAIEIPRIPKSRLWRVVVLSLTCSRLTLGESHESQLSCQPVAIAGM